jgi:hypothetical protein
MVSKFLDLPCEIRIQIYELPLADPSIVVQYLFIRNHFRSMFRNKTPQNCLLKSSALVSR